MGDDRESCEALDTTDACVATDPLLMKRAFLLGSVSTGSRSIMVHKSMAVEGCRDLARSLAPTECE